MEAKKKAKLFAWGFGGVMTMFPRLPDDLAKYNDIPRSRQKFNWYTIEPVSSPIKALSNTTTNGKMFFTTLIDNYGRKPAKH